jgi:hypothetical protein
VTNAKHIIPEGSIKLYKDLILTVPDLELKGAAMPYTSCNGHMFSFLDKGGDLALRLPEPEREEFIKTFKTGLCEAHGTVLKEYVKVPKKLFLDTKKIRTYFRISFEM